MEGTKKMKSMSFHQYSWNSEVETTWISLIGWHHKTSSRYVHSRRERSCTVAHTQWFQFAKNPQEIKFIFYEVHFHEIFLAKRIKFHDSMAINEHWIVWKLELSKNANIKSCSPKPRTATDMDKTLPHFYYSIQLRGQTGKTKLFFFVDYTLLLFDDKMLRIVFSLRI